MDAPEEDLDIKLQRVSGELITAFDQRLEPFLRKSDGSGQVRSRVRTRDASHLISNLLDPFQELPQLLDPHLPKWLPMLAGALLEYLQTRRRRPRENFNESSQLMPLPTAICKLIYTFCKIRGEKVIVRFFNVETKYLELLLSALEEAERHQSLEDASFQWTWEERYVVLLWLSHLMFAPFDLSTISSVYMEDVDIAGVVGFFWPSNVPGITIRILPVAVKYLASPGKERDAAKALLVRMALRRDMQKLGVTNALMQWAIYWLTPRSDGPFQSPYKYIGVLSFLAGILASSTETSDMEKYLSTVFYAVNAVSSNNDAMSDVVKSSAVAKKAAIKVMRSIAVSKLRRDRQDMAGIELVESTIGHLLEQLGDNDTPVRLAASKALSIITLKLPQDMASQVVAAVLESLNRNVRWVEIESDSSLPPARDLSSVDPLEWHGLMLTLSHLLYRRSPPPRSLGSIIQALLRGLSFEQRSASGGSVGSNVRDAACFGIWALARRYTTEELLAVPSEDVIDASTKVMESEDKNNQSAKRSVLQVLATHLVVTASLDAAGNIRRGSSAALQELIGRHPNTVEKGIDIVQTVDYHSVALRSKAMREVALGATQLHSQYGEALLEALLGWRGIGDADSLARRHAGISYGAVTAELARTKPNSFQVLLMSIESAIQSITRLQIRQVEERHGLLLALASVLDQLPKMIGKSRHDDEQKLLKLSHIIQRSLSSLDSILSLVETTTFRRPELIIEATCRLFISYFPILESVTLGLDASALTTSVSGPSLLSPAGTNVIANTISRLDKGPRSEDPLATRVIGLFQRNLDAWLGRPEPEVTQAASDASVILLLFLDGAQQRDEVVTGWAELIRHQTSRSGSLAGHLLALAKSYMTVTGGQSRKRADLICGSLLERWTQDQNVTVREWILQSLIQSEVLPHNQNLLLRLILEGLEDYTTNARGDVGSHVRLQAIKATKHLWSLITQSGHENTASHTVASSLLLPMLRLAAEKLDRVRVEAQSTLALALRPEPSSQLMKFTFSSQSYFLFLLNLITSDWLHASFGFGAGTKTDERMDELLAGLVVSADTGNEDLVIASRAALTDYCDASQGNTDRVSMALFRNLKARQGQDRIVVPTLEIIAFLFSVGIYQRTTMVDFKNLCLQVQKAGYKSGNVRKLEACVKVYGGVAAMGDQAVALAPMADGTLQQKRSDGAAEARKRLGALMVHPWPRVRNSVVDELWGLMSGGEGDTAEKLKGVDWGRAEKGPIKELLSGLGL
ncbi:Tubulin-specific chaperone D [Cytospora mali]|uniref:Tubulin-specific chaperone D n=1 Tax=Cytospora mali TaxID=578113 RepID=A0A194UTT7_CYTMA|nr:Tubulin-specific chaperone D [Valsa mali var. pyri (nom. inval.)]